MTGKALFTDTREPTMGTTMLLGTVEESDGKMFKLVTDDGILIECKSVLRGRFKFFDGRRVIVRGRLVGGPRTLGLEVTGAGKA